MARSLQYVLCLSLVSCVLSRLDCSNGGVDSEGIPIPGCWGGYQPNKPGSPGDRVDCMSYKSTFVAYYRATGKFSAHGFCRPDERTGKVQEFGATAYDVFVGGLHSRESLTQCAGC